MGFLDEFSLATFEDSKNSNSKFAIVGIAGSFPGAENVETFFNNLLDGKDMITDFPKQRQKDIDDFDQKVNQKFGHGFKSAGYLDDISSFDNKMFKMNSSEVKLMDPKQRLLLENAFRAFEDATMLDELDGTKTGVFIGSSNLLNYSYFDILKEVRPDLIDLASSGNMNSMLSSRISYFFNLKGPSIVIDTACSSTLIALDQACNSLSMGECDAALVSGGHIMFYPKNSTFELGIESKDMKTRTFDNDADGTGVGESIGSIVVKRLQDAIDSNDRIYCTIEGISANQDGSSIGITAPDRKAQSDLQKFVWENNDIDITKTVYIESHGTATRLGDDVEISALTNSFSDFTIKKQFCGIGSVKTNLGHTIEASGIVSLIKAIMIVTTKTIPPSINFNYPNSNIKFEDSPFYICDRKEKIQDDDFNIMVNSFGLSGTNCHLVLKPYKENIEKRTFYESKKEYPLLISGITKEHLKKNVDLLEDFWSNERNADINLYDFSWSYNKKSTYENGICLIFSEINEILNLCLSAKKALREKDGFQVLSAVGETSLYDEILENRSIPNSYYSCSVTFKTKTPDLSLIKEKFWIEKLNEITVGSNLIDILISILEKQFGFSNIDSKTEFSALNMDSIFVLKLAEQLKKAGFQQIEISDIYNSTTIDDLCKKMTAIKNIEPQKSYESNTSQDDDIAIIGIHLKTGKYSDKESFFDALMDGKSLIRSFPKKRFDDAEGLAKKFGIVYPEFSNGNFLNEIDKFDNSRFGVPSIEAELIDPSHRLMLESAYSAISDAGYETEEISGKNVGVFVGYGQDYLFNYGSYISKVDSSKVGVSNTGNMTSMISGRISHQFNLKGPSVTVDSSCSSSLAALHQAIQAIRYGDCGSAIVGTIKINICPLKSDENDIGILSKTETTRPFDEFSDGTTLGEGVCSVVIKPVKEALNDGDKIYSVIKSSAITHDGRTPGLTCPNVDSQQEVLEKAWKLSGLDVSKIPIYIETHGTGTRLGDPIEVTGINRAFSGLKRYQEIGIGSVKSNIGHLFEASGLFSIIKACLSLYKNEIPKSINFSYPNKNIDFSQSLVHPVDFNQGSLPENQAIGISSFGFSGTNVHVVMTKFFERGYETRKAAIPIDLERNRFWLQDSIKEEITNLESDQLTQILRLYFGKNLDDSKSLFELGGDSLLAISLVSEINKTLTVNISLEEIMALEKLSDLKKLISENMQYDGAGEIPLTEVKVLYKATPQQIRMFKMSKNPIIRTGLNVNICLKIEGNLDSNKLQNSLDVLVKRHESLRTSFIEKNGTLFQKINAYEQVKMEQWTLRDFDELVQLKEDFVRPFDISMNNLFRIGIASIGKSLNFLLFDVHHIVFEFHSMQIFLQELFEVYHGKALPVNRLHYKDFSEWYNANTNKREEQLKYWKNEVSSYYLKKSENKQRVIKNTIKIKSMSIEEKDIQMLDKYSKDNNVSAFSTLLSAYMLTLSQVDNLDEIKVGFPVSGRHYPGVSNVMGLFRNSLPIRMSSKEIYSEGIVRHVSKKVIEAISHQEVQTYEIEEVCNSSTSLFDNYFIYQDAVTTSDFETGDLKITTDLIRQNGMFNLKWEFVKNDGKLNAVLEYRDELYSSRKIEVYIEKFLSNLKSIVS